ncbi:MAG: tetratricopeptide repeat protein [Thermomicrobiales bacterium]
MSDAASTAHASRQPTPLVPLTRRRGDAVAALPAPLTSFVGRQQEIATARDLVRRPDVRLVTLVGPGGIGKTRLALEVATRLADDLADGVAFVPLASLADSGLVGSALARALGARAPRERTVVMGLIEYLRHRELLLFLDNFEHLLPAAPLLTELLVSCPALKILVTSRISLHLSGEHELAVPPLALPDRRLLPPVADLGESEAITLFLHRARAVRPDLTLTDENAGALVELCHYLEGLPLAIELAAPRTKLLTPSALLARLSNRLLLLTSGPRDQPARLQTMRNAIAWSYDLLDQGAQTLFRRLAVFAGGCTLAAAEAVGAGEGEPTGNVLAGIETLVDASLLRPEDQADGEVRLAMLETVREYARERLAASGEENLTRRRHAAYFLALAEEAAPGLQGLQQRAWLARLEADHDNLRAALAWFERAGEVALGLRLANALSQFWTIHGHLSEGLDWVERAIDRTRGDATLAGLRANALIDAAWLAFHRGAYARSDTFAREGLAVARELDDAPLMSKAWNGLAAVAHLQGDYVQAETCGRQALDLARKNGDQVRIANALNGLGIATMHRGDFRRAEALLLEALDSYRACGNRQGESAALANLGSAAYYQGDDARATGYAQQAHDLAHDIGNKRDMAIALNHLGQIAGRQGDYARACGLFDQSLSLYVDLGNPGGLSTWLEAFAAVAVQCGQSEPAARFLGATEGLRAAIGRTIQPASAADHERTVAAVRASLDEDRVAAAWSMGRGLPLDDVIAEARALIPVITKAATPAAAPSSSTSYGLTSREQQVLRLLADGSSDRQIADALFISHRTVMRHVTAILAKLGVDSRTAAAAAAIRDNIV